MTADRPRRSSRHAARRRALEILYEADVRERPLPVVLADHLDADEAPPDFAVSLVRGVHRHRDELDALIGRYARDWTVSRMAVVDRNVLRIGLYELLHVEDVPDAVAIDEAVELAKGLSSEEAARFVNGILAAIARERPAPSASPE